jgi:hypothetical protein
MPAHRYHRDSIDADEIGVCVLWLDNIEVVNIGKELVVEVVRVDLTLEFKLEVDARVVIVVVLITFVVVVVVLMAEVVVREAGVVVFTAVVIVVVVAFITAVVVVAFGVVVVVEVVAVRKFCTLKKEY